MTGKSFCCYRRRFQPGRASFYIFHAVKRLKRGDKVVLCCRVSFCNQWRRGNLADQEANLRKQAARYGVVVVGIVRHVGSGVDPCWLARAVAIAEPHGAKLLMESTDRAIRSPAYGRQDQNAQAREPDLESLAYVLDGVVLLTVLDPDATPTQIRAYQRRRGQAAKDHRGGRPMKRMNRRALLGPRAVELRGRGNSWNEIAKTLRVPRRTLARWVCHFAAKRSNGDPKDAR